MGDRAFGRRIAETVDLFEEKILAIFRGDDAEILGLASWAMGEAGFYPRLALLKEIVFRREPVRIYMDGDFHEKTLGRWVRRSHGQNNIRL